MQFVTDTFCTANALGVAISGLGQSQLQTSLDHTREDALRKALAGDAVPAAS